MIECPECDEGQVQKYQTPYGCKQVCDSCGHVVKDVDTYAGVMVWSHKTAPEIEIHASKASAQTVLSSSRSRVVQNPVQVRHHAPQEMGGRRQNTGRVTVNERLFIANRSTKNHHSLEARSRQHTCVIPAHLKRHVMPIEKASEEKLSTFTQFTSQDINRCLSVLPHTASIDELCASLGLRSGKTKKAIGILSWLSAFGHGKPGATTTIFKSKSGLVVSNGEDATQKANTGYNAIDRETQKVLGYKSGFTRYG